MVPHPLISEARIKSRVAELGALISRDYAGKELLLVVILKGAFVFAADLLRALVLSTKNSRSNSASRRSWA